MCRATGDGHLGKLGYRSHTIVLPVYWATDFADYLLKSIISSEKNHTEKRLLGTDYFSCNLTKGYLRDFWLLIFTSARKGFNVINHFLIFLIC